MGPKDAMICTSLQLAKLAFALKENETLKLEACRKVAIDNSTRR